MEENESKLGTVKKATEFRIVSQSINTSTVGDFTKRVNDLLAEGWDVFSAQSIGLDTGGGVGGAGNLMMVITLVKYEYLQLIPPAK